MNKLFERADAYIQNSSWKDIALLKFCLAAIGLLIGMQIPKKHRKPVTVAASLVFVATYVPLMAKCLPYLLGKHDTEEALEDFEELE